MVCPKCGFMMDALAKECPRCHGKGIEQPVQQVPPAQAPPQSALPPTNVYQQPQPYRQQPAPAPTSSADDPLSIGLVLAYAFLSFAIPLAGVFFYFGIRGRSASQARGMMACAVAGLVVGCTVLVDEAHRTPTSVSGSLDVPSSVSAPSSGAVAASGDCFGDLCIENLDSKSENSVASVTGTVVNTGGGTYSYVQVEINLYDATGAQVGSTLANVNNLEPHGKWNFQAPLFEEKATTFKVKGITAY